MFALGDFWLKTRIIINFWPILDNQVALTDFHGDEAKKIQNGRLKKLSFLKSPILRIFWENYRNWSLGYLVGLIQCSVPEGDLHCQCILSIFPASVYQFYANIHVFVNINPFLYTKDQFALIITKGINVTQFLGWAV